MIRIACFAGFCVLLSTLAGSSAAAEFRLDSYSVMRNDSDPGLAINRFIPIVPLDGDVTLDLEIGDSQTIDLFSIGTSERVLDGDDFNRDPISVMFQFSEPQPPFGSVVNGETFGVGETGFGQIAWSDPVPVMFGASNQGLLTLDLNDATFELPGEAVITATLTHVRAVPEPSTFILSAIGVFGLGCYLVCVRRKKTKERS